MMMMNSFLRFLVLSVICFAGTVTLAAQTDRDADELRDMLERFLEGAGKNDAAVHDRFWADDLIYTRGVGQRIDKAELMKGVRSAPAAKPGDPVTVYTAEEVQVRIYGNAAVVAFKLVGKTTASDGSTSVSHHLNTGTFIKRDGRWQVVAWQATPVKPAEGPSGSMNTGGGKAAERKYLRGSRGGCYYLNSSGKKTYVDKTLCSQ